MVVMLLLLLLLLFVVVVVFVSSPFCGPFLWRKTSSSLWCGCFCFWRLWGCCSREKKSFSIMRHFFFSFLFYSLFECNI